MSNVAADIFLISMSILYLAMGGAITYFLVRKIKQDNKNEKK